MHAWCMELLRSVLIWWCCTICYYLTELLRSVTIWWSCTISYDLMELLRSVITWWCRSVTIFYDLVELLRFDDAVRARYNNLMVLLRSDGVVRSVTNWWCCYDMLRSVTIRSVMIWWYRTIWSATTWWCCYDMLRSFGTGVGVEESVSGHFLTSGVGVEVSVSLLCVELSSRYQHNNLNRSPKVVHSCKYVRMCTLYLDHQIWVAFETTPIRRIKQHLQSNENKPAAIVR